MKRELIPHKIIIEFDDGSFKDGIFLYKVKEDGIISKGYKSLGIKNMGFSKPQMNDILSKVQVHAKSVENIKEV